MKVFSPIDVVTSMKKIGNLKPCTTAGYSTLDLKIGNDDIVVSVEGAIDPEIRPGQFNVEKLQVVQDISGNGEMLNACVQLRREIEKLLEQECTPDFLLQVKSIQFNNRLYISWPRKGRASDMVQVTTPSGEKLDFIPGTTGFEKFGQLVEASKKQTSIIRLYGWIRYAPDDQKIQVGITPQLIEIHLE